MGWHVQHSPIYKIKLSDGRIIYMIDSVEVHTSYLSNSGREFYVLYVARHGQDCSEAMIVYTNKYDTSDSVSGTIWVISESIFMKRFNRK